MAYTFPGIDISYNDCVKLLRKFLSGTFKKDSGNNCVGLNQNADALCFWIPKEKLDALFSDNDSGGSAADYGLRVYFGMHASDDAFVPAEIRTAYAGQHTVMLVATKNDSSNPTVPVDCIETNGGTPGTFAGRALEVGLLCPPGCTSGERVKNGL